MPSAERAGRPGDRIVRAEVHEYAFEVADLDFEPGGFVRVFTPGAVARIPNFVLVVETADGGRGEYAAMLNGRAPVLAQVLMLAPRLVGRDATAREAIYDTFKRALQQVGFLGVGPWDICLWDLVGKRLGTSITSLLGGYRARLRAYATAMHGDHAGGLSTPEEVSAFGARCADLGYRGFKFHGWSDDDADRVLATVRLLGRDLGGRVALMADLGSDLRTFADALAVGRACDDAGFLWLEDPFRDTGMSIAAHRRLRRMIRTPLLMTEHVRGLEAKAEWAMGGGTDMLRADPETDLGITGAMKVAHLAEALGMDVELHGCGPAQRACMAAIRNTNWYEVCLLGPRTGNPACPPIFACGYSDGLDAVGTDGCVPVPDGPGLGVTLDWDFIGRHATRVHRFGAT